MIPDNIRVSGPSEVVVAGMVGTHIVLAVPEDAACPGGFELWSDEDVSGHPEARAGDTIGIWNVWRGEEPLWIEARTPREAGPGIDPETAAIVASVTMPEQPLFPPAGELSDGIEYGWDMNRAHGYPYKGLHFEVPTSSWRSTGFDDVGNGSGSLIRGEPGTPDGAVITFSRPDQVYADPCAHTLLDPPPGPSVDHLAAALAAIPGTDLVSGPTDVTLGGWRSAIELVLRVREDIGCEPEEFYLWADECVTAVTAHVARDRADSHQDRLCLDSPHPRAARARGSTIRLWVATGALGLVVIDAETYEGATPEVEQEVQQIFDSIVFRPGMSG
jgi:hypothetical protein